MKKITIIGTVASSILTFRFPFVELLVRHGYEVTCLANNFSPEQIAFLKQRNVKAMNYTLSRGGLNPLKDLRDTFALAKLLRQIKPDVVFSYFVKPVIFGTLASKMAGVSRKLAMIEGLGFAFTEQAHALPFKTHLVRSIQIFLYRITLPLLDCVIFLNPDDPIDLLEKNKISIKQMKVLGGIGLDLREYPYCPAPNDSIQFIFIGRLLNEKGIREYISSAKVIKQQYPEVEFVVLGEVDVDNPGSINKEMLDSLIKEKIISYKGQVNHVAPYLAQASVFVLPSYREGVPRSTQEAMAVGRAVITTDVPGCRETVIDGVNGFLIPPWQVDTLVERMRFFIDNPDKINKMGLKSREIAEEKYDVEKVNARLLDILMGGNNETIF